MIHFSISNIIDNFCFFNKFNNNNFAVIEDAFAPKTDENGSEIKLIYPGSLYISKHGSIRPNNPCKGMFIDVGDTLIIDGSISMEARGYGLNYVPEVYYDRSTGKLAELNDQIRPSKNRLIFNKNYKHPAGGKGNDVRSGSGSGTYMSYGGAGSSGTIYSGGSGGGGGGGISASEERATAGVNYGRTGGTGARDRYNDGFGGGGVGNPGGKASIGGQPQGSGPANVSGTGGLLVIRTNRLIVGPNGTINVKGTDSVTPAISKLLAIGGGSGGGHLILSYVTAYINDGIINNLGGTPSGENGHIHIYKLNKWTDGIPTRLSD